MRENTLVKILKVLNGSDRMFESQVRDIFSQIDILICFTCRKGFLRLV